MKRILFILMEILVTSTYINAQDVKVMLKDGTEIKGELISYSESILVVEPDAFIKYSKKLKPKDVVSFEIEGVGRFFSTDGQFLLDESTVEQYLNQKQQELTDNLANDSTEEVSTDFWQRVLDERRVQKRTTLPSNPNEVIGRAFLSTGGIALGIGLPCFAAGLATCIAGNVGVTTSNVVQKANCVEASYYLLGVGACLTIVSIPLIVHGKRITEMKINYTGNSVGATMNF